MKNKNQIQKQLISNKKIINPIRFIMFNDEVILIGLDKSFPHASYGTFWLSSLFTPKNEIEPIPFAEERRVFYVGLTRTKNYVYLLVNRNSKNRGQFLNELLNLMQEKDNESK